MEVDNPFTYQTGMLRLLNYADQVLSCLYTIREEKKTSCLLAFSLAPGNYLLYKLLIRRPLRYTKRIFTRNNASYLCYSTYSTQASWDYCRWTIWIISLLTESDSKEIKMSNLMGSSIGVNVCFEIQNSYFYTISSQVSSELDKLDWTSYYHSYRFPLDNLSQDKLEVNNRLWRRDHAEGPIDNTSTDLRLQVDECTGELLIVECRCEWQLGCRSSRRAVYTQPLVFPNSQTSQHFTQLTEGVLTTQLGRHACHLSIKGFKCPGRTAGDEKKSRLSCYRLPRYVINDNLYSNTYLSGPATKLRYFASSTTTALDLVQDASEFLGDAQFPPVPRLRLHIETRRLRPPKRDAESLLVRTEIDGETGLEKEGSDEVWIQEKARVWPPYHSAPSAAVLDLYSILDPFAGRLGELKNTGHLVAVADERSVVYSIGAPNSASRAIVLVNFDSFIQIKGPRAGAKGIGIHEAAASPSAASGAKEGTSLNGDTLARQKEYQWSWEESARYLQIGKGMWLR